MNAEKSSNSQFIRQTVLIVILIIVLAGFLLDKFVLFPNAEKKINEVMETVSKRLSEDNRQEIHDILGRKPTRTFTHNGIEVEQYRFPRGLPFFPRPILDVAFDGDTLAFFRQTEIDNAYIESQRGVTKIDRSLKFDPGTPVLAGVGGGSAPKPNKDDENSSDDENEESSDDSSESESEDDDSSDDDDN